MKRRGALGAIVVALAITAAACGGGTTGNAAVSIKTLKAAASNTQDASSYQFTMNMKVTAQDATQELAANGAQAADGSQMQFTMDFAGLGTMEMRLVDETIYLNMGDIPGASSELPDGKRWISVTFDEMKSQTGVDFQQLVDQAQQTSPTQGLQYLEGLSGDVTKIGDDTVNGEHAVHYQASIDYSKLGDKLDGYPDEVRKRVEALPPVPVDVWINDQDQVVKVDMTIDVGAMGFEESGKVEMSMEMHSFGEPVDVQPPPADETVDLSTLTSQDA
jgi:hypothetical protein